MPGSPSPTPRGSWRTRMPSWAACTGPSYLTWGTPDQSTAWAEQLHENSPHGWKLCKLRWSGQTRITILSDTLKGRLIKNINRALDFFYFSFASCLALVGVYVGWGSCKSNSKPRDFWRFGAFFNTLHFGAEEEFLSQAFTNKRSQASSGKLFPYCPGRGWRGVAKDD